MARKSSERARSALSGVFGTQGPNHDQHERIDGRIKPCVASLWRRFYPDYDPHAFNWTVLERAPSNGSVLEIGCSDGRNSPALRERVACYAGIDPNDRVMTHKGLDIAVVSDIAKLPWPDHTFDLVFHRMVAEHLPDPVVAMRETARVLKPSGRLFFETPNRW